MTYQFVQEEPDRTVEVDFNGDYDLTLTQADMWDNHTVFRRINLTVINETDTDYEVEMEVLDRFHDEPMSADFEIIPVQGDHDERTVTERFSKDNLDDLSHVRSGVPELEQLKKPLVEWHERTPANLNVPY